MQVVVVLGISVISLFLLTTKHENETLEDAANNVEVALLNNVVDRAHFLVQVNASAFAVAEALGSPKHLSFLDIENKVTVLSFSILLV